MIDDLWQGAGDVLARFGDVDPRLVVVALVLHVGNHVLRSVAWCNVLRAAYPSERVPLLTVASSYAVGVALNAVVPGRGGDAAKVALLRMRLRGSTVPGARPRGSRAASSRSVISSAARLLNVIARIASGDAPVEMSQAALATRVVVLPEPAGATQRMGPDGAVAAARWSGASRSSRSTTEGCTRPSWRHALTPPSSGVRWLVPPRTETWIVRALVHRAHTTC